MNVNITGALKFHKIRFALLLFNSPSVYFGIWVAIMLNPKTLFGGN